MAPVNITLPDGWTTHGVDGLICSPAKWYTVLSFLVINYAAHCATIKTYPGESFTEVTVASVLAFFIPSSGILRALDAIRRRPRWRKMNELERAGAANALCIVVRNVNWRPRVGDRLLLQGKGPDQEESSTEGQEDAKPFSVREPDYYDHSRKPRMYGFGSLVSRSRCKIHGLYTLPDGYDLAYLPQSASLKPLPPAIQEKLMTISSTNNTAKALIAIFQICYGSVVLYLNRGDQVALYGDAAFSLTVVPYVFMSLLNLVAQLACADYPTVYMVRTPEMDEAARRGGVFYGVVGDLDLVEWDRDRFGTHPDKAHTYWNGAWEVVDGEEQIETEKFGTTSAWRLRRTRADGREWTMRIHVVPWSNRVNALSCAPFRLRSDAGFLTRMTEVVLMYFLLPLILCAFAVVVVYEVTKFQPGTESTPVQRGFVISWIVVGMTVGCITPSLMATLTEILPGLASMDRLGFVFVLILSLVVGGAFFVPAWGGLVVVIQMLMSYGDCTRIG